MTHRNRCFWVRLIATNIKIIGYLIAIFRFFYSVKTKIVITKKRDIQRNTNKGVIHFVRHNAGLFLDSSRYDSVYTIIHVYVVVIEKIFYNSQLKCVDS